MRVQLFNDKQVTKVVESVKRQFVIDFEKAKEELEALMDAEVQRQTESGVEVLEYIEKRKNDLEVALKLQELNKQVEEISENYHIAGGWRYPGIIGFNQEAYDQETQNTIEIKAKNAAKCALGLNDLMYRENCLLDDITARVAVMAVSDYDDVVALLNTKINIKDYFVTL